jgi:hypothetical protein
VPQQSVERSGGLQLAQVRGIRRRDVDRDIARARDRPCAGTSGNPRQRARSAYRNSSRC